MSEKVVKSDELKLHSLANTPTPKPTASMPAEPVAQNCLEAMQSFTVGVAGRHSLLRLLPKLLQKSKICHMAWFARKSDVLPAILILVTSLKAKATKHQPICVTASTQYQ
jgi:hypothetical protein